MIDSLAARAATLSSHRLDETTAARPVSLEQQKKRAKELLKASRNGEPDALARLAQHARSVEAGAPKLADAQHVIARELGFSKWEGLKAHAERARMARDILRSGAPSVPDKDARTLHIRCGSDIRDGLAIAGFRGDYLSFAYPFVHGPAPSAEPVSNFIEIGARFLSSVSFVQTEAEARSRLTGEFAGLAAAADYDRICFWFEHDAYDQLCLVFLLDWFSKSTRRPRQVDLICVSDYPGFPNFHGLGQLPPDAFRVLWQSRQPVTVEQYGLGQAAWQALIQPGPRPLFDLATDGTPQLPTLAPAILRQLRELPALANGLGFTEQLALSILEREGSMTAGRLFGRYTNHYEPLVFMGDLGFYDLILCGLAAGPRPAITLGDLDGEEERWRREVRLTDTAKALLERRVSWLDIAPVHRWVGGVEIRSGAPVWCWDDGSERPTLRD